MAFDAVNKGTGKGISVMTSRMSGSFGGASSGAAGNPANTNQHTRKTALIVGSNAAAHYALRYAIQSIADRNIPCDIYLTDIIANTQDLKEKINRPETRNFSFYEHLMINHGYDILEQFDQRDGMELDLYGDLRHDLQYSPQQIERHYSGKRLAVTVTDMADPSLPLNDRDINYPNFVSKIANDQTLARAYNIRSMQILKPATIRAFENKTMNGFPSRIINAHPGEVITYPGTNIAFWARMNKYPENVWTLHVIDQGIDTGDVVDQASQMLKAKKTLLQDMLGMAQSAGNMIGSDNRLFFNGTPRPAIPQKSNPDYANRPKDNYTFATHQEWLDSYNRGIRAVNPQNYIEALVRDYTGSLTSERSVTLHRALAQATLDWQKDYLQIYQAEYGTYPPEYDPQNPQDYFVTVPPPYQPPANSLVPNGPGGQNSGTP